ncbi:lipase family protein [Hoeflea sp.]|uniref:lipase family protein n=1 Tax=Hoeflea sp. TaxID=1940281 RepID=UPI003B013AE5
MRRFRVSATVLLAALTVLSACTTHLGGHHDASIADRPAYSQFPYDPLVYHLDLSILAYQLYGQTLVWPFDPYYEEAEEAGAPAEELKERVRQWAAVTGRRQIRQQPFLGGYRGPGLLSGFADNPRHDPIVYRYDGLYPWQAILNNTGGKWVEYRTPTEITSRIASVHMCYRRTGRPAGDVAVRHVVSNRAARASGARDIVLAFEGGTGNKGEPDQPASQSLMGYVLVRYPEGSDGYDIHIAFRGSRGGSVLNSILRGASTTDASGNPDWISDLGYRLVPPQDGVSAITTIGTVHRGIAHSTEETLPRLFKCLERAAALQKRRAPKNIYVTGHSLGGGIAQHFVSALFLGDKYGPSAAGPAMPGSLRNWPWQQLKLITYGAPRVGSPLWADTMTTEWLDSDFNAGGLLPIDLRALSIGDPRIAERLADTDAPVGYGVQISNDAITTGAFPGPARKPVGTIVYVDRIGPLSLVKPYSPRSHDPEVIRDTMIARLDDPGIPPVAWRYYAFGAAPTGGIKSRQTSDTVLEAVQSEMLDYQLANDPHFNRQVYKQREALFNSFVARLLRSPD